jgi:glutamine amidotransferase-like uncharacterized protein
MPRFAVVLAAATVLAGGVAACDAPQPNAAASILLFDGTGTSPNDVAAVKAILRDNKLGYATANSAQLNSMGDSALRAYRLLIVPGGNFITMGDSLTPATLASIHGAVQGGLNYLGICAGAFLAGTGKYKSINLTSGVRFNFYAVSAQGVRKTAVPISTVGGPTLDQYWEDGPELSGWGAVVAKYPDGTPAVVQGAAGRGWVVLTGIHAEAPESWRSGLTFTTPASVDNAYAFALIDAALNRTPLPHY